MPRTSDIQKQLIAHVKASNACKRWAKKAVELEDAGKKREAAQAREKARGYMRAMLKIEGKL